MCIYKVVYLFIYLYIYLSYFIVIVMLLTCPETTDVHRPLVLTDTFPLKCELKCWRTCAVPCLIKTTETRCATTTTPRPCVTRDARSFCGPELLVHYPCKQGPQTRHRPGGLNSHRGHLESCHCIAQQHPGKAVSDTSLGGTNVCQGIQEISHLV